jgi:hypothetical protein
MVKQIMVQFEVKQNLVNNLTFRAALKTIASDGLIAHTDEYLALNNSFVYLQVAFLSHTNAFPAFI